MHSRQTCSLLNFVYANTNGAKIAEHWRSMFHISLQSIVKLNPFHVSNFNALCSFVELICHLLPKFLSNPSAFWRIHSRSFLRKQGKNRKRQFLYVSVECQNSSVARSVHIDPMVSGSNPTSGTLSLRVRRVISSL